MKLKRERIMKLKGQSCFGFEKMRIDGAGGVVAKKICWHPKEDDTLRRLTAEFEKQNCMRGEEQGIQAS